MLQEAERRLEEARAALTQAQLTAEASHSDMAEQIKALEGKVAELEARHTDLQISLDESWQCCQHLEDTNSYNLFDSLYHGTCHDLLS